MFSKAKLIKARVAMIRTRIANRNKQATALYGKQKMLLIFYANFNFSWRVIYEIESNSQLIKRCQAEPSILHITLVLIKPITQMDEANDEWVEGWRGEDGSAIFPAHRQIAAH